MSFPSSLLGIIVSSDFTLGEWMEKRANQLLDEFLEQQLISSELCKLGKRWVANGHQEAVVRGLFYRDRDAVNEFFERKMESIKRPEEDGIK